MTKMFKRILSMMLVLTLLFLATVPVFAAGADEEEYLSDLRIVYADNYSEAVAILAECDLEGYKVLNDNLNENTGKIGVWLAYKTTTDIEDAITDIAVMQMNGGYNEGNYQEMIKQSYAEYVAMGENYDIAIEYFAAAYNAGHYLSDIAYRQLNFYNVVTEGIEEIPDFEGERLGDIFLDGIDATELATMFMEGNSYALDNIRSLIAMGVSYNEDGMTYLEKVAEEAEKLIANPDVYENESYGEMAELIAPVIIVFRDMFKELETYESELNYEDEDFTDLEMEYLEYMSMATKMRNVNYLDGKTLYDFCMEYKSGNDLSALYPLVAAMNEGQLAMAKVNHYYDVVRYSVSMLETEELEAELSALEEKYSANPFNVYAGVDRTIYRDTFALTSAAYRADAFTESGLSAYLWHNDGSLSTAMNIVGIVGASICLGGVAAKMVFRYYTNEYHRMYDNFIYYERGYDAFRSVMETNCIPKDDPAAAAELMEKFSNMRYYERLEYLNDYFAKNPTLVDEGDKMGLDTLNRLWERKFCGEVKPIKTARSIAEAGQKAANFVYGVMIVGGIMSVASAIRAGYEVWNYYHPEYDDIPTAMVDLIETKDGDRYIKYDVVYEAEVQADGNYAAADLNAFKGQRWNALYYTKSYEAGKPILADGFVVSHSNNVPAENYAPVHRFGEVVCYNLNKYNYNDDCSIYLYIKQSENQKYAVAEVPEVVGSVFGTGFYFLAGGVGIIVGAGATIGTQEIIKKRKNKAEVPTEVNTEE